MTNTKSITMQLIQVSIKFSKNSKCLRSKNSSKLIAATRKIPPGNLTERFNLKKRLQCKNFQWYLDNIYPESNWRREYKMMGEVCKFYLQNNERIFEKKKNFHLFIHS